LIRVEPYRPEFQPGIDQMMDGIAAEYEEAITGPHSARLPEYCNCNTRNE
jgi:hypothetical protein